MNKTMHNPKNFEGTVIRYPNSNYNYTWRCLGKFIPYATCPSSRRNVKIAENKIEAQLQPVRVGRHSQAAVDPNTLARG